MVGMMHGNMRRSGRFIRRLVTVIVGVLVSTIFPTFAETGPSLPTLTEKYLLDQIAAGKVANLKEEFPDETARVVRAAFLEGLLAGTQKEISIHRNGVLIQGAIVHEAVDLRNVEVAHDTRLAGCRFEGEVNFSKSNFENSFSVEGSFFNGPANFQGMKVGRGAFLQKAVFSDHVDFSQVEITGALMAGEASFRHPKQPAEFAGLKVSGNTVFTKAVFASAVNFQNSRVADNFKLDGARFTNRSALVSFEAMKVAAVGSFNGVSFNGYVSFKDANFKMLDLSAVNWPSQVRGEWLWLNGMTYQRIAAGSEKESWNNLFKLVDRAAHRSAYSMDIYSALMEFYRREGYPRQANLLSIAQKRREREEVLQGAAWWWNLFLDGFVGYGRSPERAFLWSTAIMLFGTWVFRAPRMEPRKIDFKPDRYSPFWYSVDLFLPLVKLQDADFWKPRDDARFARFWSRFHTMLGWALIPIAVAAWTGMLEK
jgi:uncharacterized protein YjbI with pentapeptide repeats